MTKLARALALLLLALASGCASIVVTPVTVRAAAAPLERREATLAAWTEAVARANEFLASPFRRTLPPSRIEFDDTGMRLVAESRAWPLELHCTTYGDLVNWAGFVAQEREYGMVVGLRDGLDDRSVNNSLFASKDGELHSSDSIAETVLHEATHVVYRDGTVGFWNGVAYYLEAVFLLRAVKHSAERRPYATSHEYAFFRLWREANAESRAIYWRLFEEHLADRTKHCRHGEPAADGAERTAPTPP